MNRFLDLLHSYSSGLDCAGESEADRFECWYQDLRAGKVNESHVMNEICIRFRGTGNDDLIEQFVCAFLGREYVKPGSAREAELANADREAMRAQGWEDPLGVMAMREEARRTREVLEQAVRRSDALRDELAASYEDARRAVCKLVECESQRDALAAQLALATRALEAERDAGRLEHEAVYNECAGDVSSMRKSQRAARKARALADSLRAQALAGASQEGGEG